MTPVARPSGDLPFRAFVLAGGMGLRLRSVISDRPKPMAPVLGAPFLEILLDSLCGKGVREFVLLTGYRGEVIEECFQARVDRPYRVFFSREPQPLGTGGAVKLAGEWATDPTLLVNGDTFYDVDLERLFRFHAGSTADVTLSLMLVEDSGRYGSVDVDAEGRVIGFQEKREAAGPGLINAGCSLLSGEFIRNLPADRPFSMEQEIFPKTAQAGKMYGMADQRAFFDIGTPESYEAFKEFAAKTWRTASD